MATEQTEDATNADFANGLTVPEVGDSFNTTCGTVLPPLFQQVGDRFQALQRVTPGAGPSVSIKVPLDAPTFNSLTRFAQTNNGVSPYVNYWQQSSVVSTGQLNFDLAGVIPQAGTIQSIKATLRAASHVGLPATMPKLTLWSFARNVGSTWPPAGTSIATVTDSASLANYQLVHEISVGSIAHAIDPANEYILVFAGEYNTNAVVGTALIALDVEIVP
jgi:hypothetical protein